MLAQATFGFRRSCWGEGGGEVDVGSRTKDLSSNVALCFVVLRRWEWSSLAFRFHDVVSFQR